MSFSPDQPTKTGEWINRLRATLDTQLTAIEFHANRAKSKACDAPMPLDASLNQMAESLLNIVRTIRIALAPF